MFKRVAIGLLISSLPLAGVAKKLPLIKNKPQASCSQAYKEKQYQQAFPLCKKAAAQDNPTAWTLLGLMYHRGQGVARDDRLAMQWLEKAAKAEVVAAQFTLAKIYSMDIITATDPTKAFQYYSAAANRNFPPAQLMVALCYQVGFGVDRDFNKSLMWYQNAQRNGIQGPMLSLENGRQEESYRTMASTPGQKSYQMAMSLANLYDEKDQADFVGLLTEAASQGHAQAQYQLAMEYQRGIALPQDDSQAIEWLQQAAKQNHQEAQSQLAWMTALGLGVEEDFAGAAQWFVASRQRNDFNTESLDATVAQLSSTDSDVILPKKASEQFTKGIQYFEAQMEDSDRKAALALIEKAASNDLKEAQAFMGDLYRNGNAVEQNPGLAFEYYEKAALNGDANAQYELAWLYAQGAGTPQNYAKAKVWLEKAQLNGHPRARSAKNFIATQMAKVDLPTKANPQVARKEFSLIEMAKQKHAQFKQSRVAQAQTKPKAKAQPKAKAAKTEVAQKAPNQKVAKKSAFSIKRLFAKKAKPESTAALAQAPQTQAIPDKPKFVAEPAVAQPSIAALEHARAHKLNPQGMPAQPKPVLAQTFTPKNSIPSVKERFGAKDETFVTAAGKPVGLKAFMNKKHQESAIENSQRLALKKEQRARKQAKASQSDTAKVGSKSIFAKKKDKYSVPLEKSESRMTELASAKKDQKLARQEKSLAKKLAKMNKAKAEQLAKEQRNEAKKLAKTKVKEAQVAAIKPSTMGLKAKIKQGKEEGTGLKAFLAKKPASRQQAIVQQAINDKKPETAKVKPGKVAKLDNDSLEYEDKGAYDSSW